MRSPSASATFGACPLVSCAICTNGFADDPPGLHRNRPVPGAVRALRRLSVGDQGRRDASGFLADLAHRVARYRRASAGGRQLHLFRAFHRRGTGLDLRAGAHGERRIRAGADQVTAGATARNLGQAAWLKAGALARLLGVLDGDGEEARVVGGAVRNALLEMPIAEIDVATTAVPDEVIKRVTAAGFKPVPTGIEHGTITVVIEKHPFEVTTLRRDVETYGRHAKVAFGRDWKTDAERRDFTINALSATRDGAVYDYVGGLDDLAARLVRFIGDPGKRIAEDYLRILRFFRFHAAYGTSDHPDAEGIAACIAGRDAFGVGMIAGAIGGMEAEETQDSQIVFRDALCRIADEAHAPRRQIVKPADIIIDRAVARGRQRVDGEIPPLGVDLPVAAEGDLGVAAKGLHVLAQRGHLERMLVDDDGDGAVLDPRGHRLEAGRRDALDHLVRHRRGGDVDFMDRNAEQRVAHRAADHARLLAVTVEHPKQTRQRACRQPGRVAQAARGRAGRHLVCPGTNTPFSMCAGT